MSEKASTATKAGNEPASKGSQRESPSPEVLGLMASTVLGLQQTAGNRTVGALLGGALLQPKLRIGPPGDAYEREADRVADVVLRGGGDGPLPVSVVRGGSGVQRMCQECEEEMLQRKCHCQEEEDLVQPKSDGGPSRSTSGFESRVESLRGSGRPLPSDVRGFFEPRFGHDFGAVRVHTGGSADEAARAVRARAFTVGNDIVFGAGEWSPENVTGKRLLAHELTHVVQQTPVARRKPILQRAPQEVSDAAPGIEVPVPEQEAPESAPEPAPSPGEPTPEAAPAEQTPATALIVEDDATEVGQGQMKKSEFLARLHPEVCAAAEAGLAGTEHSAQGCPFIEFWFGYYEGQSAERFNRDLPRFAGEGPQPTTAEEYIVLITTRVRQSVEMWARTGEITGVPSGIPLPGMGLLGNLRAFRAPGISFMARPGGPANTLDPAVFRDELGPGRALESGLRSRMESAFGRSFAQVRVHTEPAAGRLSERLNARAFAVGSHVAFGAGEYRPGTLVGDALIAHELAHTAQQTGDQVPAVGGSSTYQALEHDADRAAAGAVISQSRGLSGALRNLLPNAQPRMRSGLRLQRCCNCGKDASTGSVSAGSIRGGVTGLNMDVTATYSDCSACADGLEAIQVVWATGGAKVGSHDTAFPPLAATYYSFVDGGQNSPGGAVYSGNHPYYIGRSDLPNSYGYIGGQGSAGSVSCCEVNVKDVPGAVLGYDEAYFETAFVCLNYQKKGSDKLLDAFKWGFINKGTKQKPSPYSPVSSAIETASTPSGKFRETLSADYAGYSHF